MEPVSIIIPTFNRAYCIEMSIKSVLNQTYSKFELLIVDDGSTDNTENLVKNMGDVRIRYIKMSENRGPSAARNYGINCSQYDIVAFHDSDDEWEATKLEKQMKLLCDNDIGMVYTQMRCIDKNTGGEMLIPGDDGIPEQYRSGYIYPYLFVRNYIGAPTIVARKACLVEVGGFDEQFKCLEDWDLALKLSKQYQIGYVDEPLYISYRGDNNSVDSNIDNHFNARCMIVKKYKDDLIRFNYLESTINEILTKASLFNREGEVATKLLGILKE